MGFLEYILGNVAVDDVDIDMDTDDLHIYIYINE